MHLKYLKSPKRFWWWWCRKNTVFRLVFLIQTCGKFGAQVWVYRLFLQWSHRQKVGESSQNWQWRQIKCPFGNFWQVKPIIWNTSVNYKGWCAHAVDFYTVWALFTHWLAEAAAAILSTGPMWFLIVSENEIAAMKALIPECPWNSGTITDQPTQVSKKSVPVVPAVVKSLHMLHKLRRSLALNGTNNANIHFLVDSV